MKLIKTIPYMLSEDYKERLTAEYRQTKERYEHLKRFHNKIEAEEQQQKVMGGYLHTLEVRVVIEKNELAEPKTPEEPEPKNSEKLTRIYKALKEILKDLDSICSDEQELLIAMDEMDLRYEGKELVLGCIEQASADIGEAYEIIESILEDE